MRLRVAHQLALGLGSRVALEEVSEKGHRFEHRVVQKILAGSWNGWLKYCTEVSFWASG